MKQTARIISTYTADVSGVCSALYEYGGMTIMHDASGCNSTYNTHDEARWYTMDSLVFVSGISEMEAIMGDDEKIIGDIIDAANELHPAFIAIAGTPIPMMIGTDLPAIASIIEKRTGIPSFGFNTNSMHSYISGASMAFSMLARNMTDKSIFRSNELSVNILGTTPLDFSINGSVQAINSLLIEHGFNIISNFGMGGTLADIKNAGLASVNLVVSYTGLAAAKELHRLFGTPYVIGVPMGDEFSNIIICDLLKAKDSGKCINSTAIASDFTDFISPNITIIGESVYSASLAAAIGLTTGKTTLVVCPVTSDSDIVDNVGVFATDEDELMPLIDNSQIVIADPLYKPLCTDDNTFIELPHEAFSGRIFRALIPNLITDFSKFIKNII